MEEGVRRWVVDISKWNPKPTQFSFALSLLPSQQHSSITRFFKIEDRKRALISQMLQYTLLYDLIKINIPFIIKRTSQNKPFLDLLDYDKLGLTIFPNFNFNVSHHGDYVAIASEPLCLVGIDIVSFDIPPQGETVAEFIRFFSSYFSSLEWDNIINAGTSNHVLIEFYKYWSLKEAYVKAMGSGLIEGLNKVEFSHTNWTNISATMDGEVMALWRFWLIELGERHCVAIARGPPKSADISYKSTLKKVEFTEEEYNIGLHLPNVDFVELSVEQLISILQQSLYCEHIS
ncbi:L-aminoadipate-semialdehyde dehydrogenase-phosphopantetheinyl transferase-like [Trifolium pratense]|uniref:L-aminoadipate-semialdehyde dehydrogenase-phosphopantetheinyl transferase-like n=1 Tax=Trifolium pratense TaxID=57577 RepID=UPI001E693193|nr:L-aminoadipate-semialdehyde dehydrogenase-phosphopantetheinyl transferase-like [Trifolium pratense]